MHSKLRSLICLSAIGAASVLTACEGSTNLVASADPSAPAFANVPGRQYRLLIPSEAQFPFYSRTELDLDGEYGYQTDAWAAVVFYRDPAGVPAAFNLLSFYDFAGIPDIFGVPATVSGFGVFDEPTGSAPPKQSHLGGSAVPVWFVARPEFDALIADGELTMPELSAAASLRRATASRFSEVLHSNEAHPQPRVSINAAGAVEGGGTFSYKIVWNGQRISERRHVSITFRP